MERFYAYSSWTASGNRPQTWEAVPFTHYNINVPRLAAKTAALKKELFRFHAGIRLVWIFEK